MTKFVNYTCNMCGENITGKVIQLGDTDIHVHDECIASLVEPLEAFGLDLVLVQMNRAESLEVWSVKFSAITKGRAGQLLHGLMGAAIAGGAPSRSESQKQQVIQTFMHIIYGEE